MHLLRTPAQAGLKPSLPCVKGGGTACRDGGIVKSDNLHKTIPQSASLTAPFTQGSLWHKIILRWIFICFLLIGKAFMEPRLYGGVFVLQKQPSAFLRSVYFLLLIFIYFLLIGKAFMEPRHYGGVFVLQ